MAEAMALARSDLPALRDQRFYHVVPDDCLAAIARDGLLPRALSGAASNFPGLQVADDCVYLHPSVGCAQGWLCEHDDRGTFGNARGVILQVDDVDLSLLAPDHEDFARHWTHPGVDAHEGFEDLLRHTSEVLFDASATGEGIDHAESLALIASMPDDLRLRWVEACVRVGDSVMLRGSIEPTSLTIVEPLREEYIIEIAERMCDEGDIFGWLSDLDVQGKVAISEMDLRYMGQDPQALVGNLELRHFISRSLLASG